VPYVEYDEVEAICSDCGRTFRSEEALYSHREESHPPSLVPPPLPARSTPHGRSTGSPRAKRQ